MGLHALELREARIVGVHFEEAFSGHCIALLLYYNALGAYLHGLNALMLLFADSRR